MVHFGLTGYNFKEWLKENMEEVYESYDWAE
jgi:hypothetical protein